MSQYVHQGVYSDIAMPTRLSFMETGERDLEGALSWDKVAQAKYTQSNSYPNIGEVIYNSKERMHITLFKDGMFCLYAIDLTLSINDFR